MTNETKHTGYEVTRDGHIFSLLNWRGTGRRELGQSPNKSGYPSVRLVIDGKRKRLTVHRLVALEYLPLPPSEKHELRHLDGTKTNNHASNLQWGTQRENADDRERHGKTSRGIAHSEAIKKGIYANR